MSDTGQQKTSGAELWDEHADWWRERFTAGADIEYDQEILPLVVAELSGARRVLDLGCGEGQVARSLAAAGPSVVGVDPSIGQLAHAKAAGAALDCVLGAGEHLPFAKDSFDAVLCCLSIEHADDVDAVFAEVLRVLEPGGTFLLLINHPIYQGPGSGFVDDQILGERYWRVGPYLEEQTVIEQVDASVALPFAHRPLSRYINPLAGGDLLLVAMVEPRPLAAFLIDSLDPELEGAIPRLLALRFEHRPALSDKGDAARRARGTISAGGGDG